MKKYVRIFLMYLLFVVCFSCKRQGQTEQSKVNADQSNSEIFDTNSTIIIADTIVLPHAPARITRKIRTDKNGNLLFAAYENIIKYDGNSFREIEKHEGLKSLDAFDAYEDKKGNIWVASTHLGVFRYDGKTYNNFTKKEGLAHNRAMCIHEDETGKIWIGTEGGISCYNGKQTKSKTPKL